MALPVAATDINAFTNRWIVPRAADLVYKDSPLFVRMIGKQQVKFEGGTSIVQPLIYAPLTGGFFARTGTFNTDYVQTDTAFNVNMKYAYVGITLYGTDQVLNRGREAAFSQVEVKFANAAMRMAEILAQELYKDGASTTDNVTNSGGVLSTSSSLDGLLAWIDDGSESSVGYSTAEDVTKSFTAIGGITRKELFSSSPTWSAATSTVAGAIGGANAYCNRAFTNFDLPTVNAAYGHAWYGNKFVDLILTGQNGWNRFWNAIQPNQRYLEDSSDVAKVGFQSLRFNSASLVVDKNMPAQLMLGLNTNFITLYVTSNPRYQFGFTGFKESVNSDNLTGQYLFSGNVVVSNPRTCFKLIGSALA